MFVSFELSRCFYPSSSSTLSVRADYSPWRDTSTSSVVSEDERTACTIWVKLLDEHEHGHAGAGRGTTIVVESRSPHGFKVCVYRMAQGERLGAIGMPIEQCADKSARTRRHARSRGWGRVRSGVIDQCYSTGYSKKRYQHCRTLASA